MSAQQRGRQRLLVAVVAALVVVVVLVLGFVTPGWFVTRVFDAAAVQTGVAKVLADDYATDGVADVRCPQNVQVTRRCDVHLRRDDRRRPRHDPDHGDRRPRRLPGGAAGLSGHPVRALADGELRAAHDLFGGSLHRAPVDDARWARRRASYTPGRTFGAFDPDGRLVGTTMSYPSRTAVPGGAVLPLAAVTRVGVRADRTRRGLATALMRAQLDDLRARGDVARAAVGDRERHLRPVRLRRRHPGTLRPGPRVAGGAAAGGARGRDGAGAGPGRDRPRASAVHDTLALRRPGGITRTPGWWEV